VDVCIAGGVVWRWYPVSCGCGGWFDVIHECSWTVHGAARITQPWGDMDVWGDLRPCYNAIITGQLMSCLFVKLFISLLLLMNVTLHDVVLW